MLIGYLAKSGELDTIKFLVEKGANPDQPNEEKRTPFLLSIIQDHYEVTKYLAEECKVNVNAIDCEEKGALMHCIRAESLDDIKYLIENCHIDYKTDLDWAIEICELAELGEEKIKYFKSLK
mmetsp:Transcript_22959/g.19921  ORF Transcript_22959/g.19921 Transcript_22959/m.19921 type:complete len:122 (-) Transcript_22959:92-457(-)